LNAQGQLQRGYLFVYSVNEGEGYLLNASGSMTEQLVSVRRLTTPSTIGTGIVFKEAEQSQPDITLLEQALSDLATQSSLQ